MDAISRADPVLVRRAAARIHRFDIAVMAGRPQFAPGSGERLCFDLVNAATRRRLLHALDVARDSSTGPRVSQPAG